jgi:hypothetical protein
MAPIRNTTAQPAALIPKLLQKKMAPISSTPLPFCRVTFPASYNRKKQRWRPLRRNTPAQPAALILELVGTKEKKMAPISSTPSHSAASHPQLVTTGKNKDGAYKKHWSARFVDILPMDGGFCRSYAMSKENGPPTKRQVSKRQVSKRLVSKRPVLKRQVYKTSGLQNVRFQNVWFQHVQYLNLIYLLNKKDRNCQVCIPI